MHVLLCNLYVGQYESESSVCACASAWSLWRRFDSIVIFASGFVDLRKTWLGVSKLRCWAFDGSFAVQIGLKDWQLGTSTPPGAKIEGSGDAFKGLPMRSPGLLVQPSARGKRMAKYLSFFFSVKWFVNRGFRLGVGTDAPWLPVTWATLHLRFIEALRLGFLVGQLGAM